MINENPRCFVLLPILLIPIMSIGHIGESIEKSNSDLYVDPDYTDNLNQTLRSVSDIPIGVAVDSNLLRYNQQYRNIVAHHFSSITPENAMKMGPLVPLQGDYNWINADLIVNFAEQINTSIHGHTLVWHSQLPTWVDSYSGSSEDWIKLLKTHIQTVVGRYKGRVQSWDVLNEAVRDDGSGYRNTIWFENIGSDYIEYAFRWAHEADPEAKLFYNDYSLSENSPKLDFVVSMITSLKAEGVPIHGIRFQMHITNEWPSLNQMQGAIDKIEELDLELKITELDISMNSQEIHSSLTNELAQEQKKRYFDVVSLFLQSSKLTGLTLWGVSDKDSWIPHCFNRSDWPLLFDTNYDPKPAVKGFLEALRNTTSEPAIETTTKKPTSSTAQPSDSPGFSSVVLLILIITVVSFRRSKK